MGKLSLAVVALVAAVLAPAASSSSRTTLVIRVKSVLVAHTLHDGAPTGPSVGTDRWRSPDALVFYDDAKDDPVSVSTRIIEIKIGTCGDF